MSENDERAIKVASLSELSSRVSKSISYAPTILKLDVSQFFASIYTHSIPWARHGKTAAKADQKIASSEVYFNALDFFVRNCQSGQTRGVLVGPDAFRLIAEYISCEIDREIQAAAGGEIVGAVRHVDDYYIGVRSEADAAVVMSRVREALANFELNLNDSKTRIFSSLEPVNDIWAQLLRRDFGSISKWGAERSQIEILLAQSFDRAKALGSDSPVKIALRGLDNAEIHSSLLWEDIEGHLQRAMYYHPHAIDYICLLVVKRVSVGQQIDYQGWRKASEFLIARHLPHRNHHEIIWLIWMLLSCEIDLDEKMLVDLARLGNAHINALLLQAFAEGRIDRKPKIGFHTKLASTDDGWLCNLVARVSGATKASFGGHLAGEFEHLAGKRVKLIDLEGPLKGFRVAGRQAISRARYGYDDPDGDDDNNDWDDDF